MSKHNGNIFPSVEYAVRHAVTVLGVDTVSAVLDIAPSSVYAGCNPNDRNHGFPNLTFKQVQTLIRALKNRGEPEYFTAVLTDLHVEEAQAIDMMTALLRAEAEHGDVARSFADAMHPNSENGVDLSGAEAARILKEVAESKEATSDVERLALAVLRACRARTSKAVS